MKSNNKDFTYQEWNWLKYKSALERKKFEIEQCYGIDYNTYLAHSKSGQNAEIDYEKYPAKPTRYNGQYFRSQLEATWAAFFNEVVEAWEYEPKDAKNLFLGWRPDFKIVVHQTPVYCEVKPLCLSNFPDWLAEKIVDAELQKRGRQDNNVKLAILGNAAPLFIEGIPSLGYISLKRRDNQRAWLPFSVTNKITINQIWAESQKNIQAQPGLTHVSDCLTNSFVEPVENFGVRTIGGGAWRSRTRV
jgi:hypothetical protein